MGSAVTETGLERHLAEFKAAGIGGVEVQPIYEAQAFEERIRTYLSPEWLDALDLTVKRARRLGLEVDLTCGSGWNFGGPWVAPELSAGRVLTQRWELAEGERLGVPVRTNQPGHPGLTQEEQLSLPEFRPPMPPLPSPPLAALVARESSSGETIDLTALVDADDQLDWAAPPGQWQLIGVFSGLRPQRVQRATPGAKGLQADFFSADSIEQYLDHIGDALGRGRRGIRAMFHDSFEIDWTDWTRGLIEEFSSRRGYDPVPHLPELLDGPGVSDARLRVLSDMRETLSDLFIQNFAEQWTDWSGEHGWLTRNQAHGSPANLLDLWAAADIPETEYAAGADIPIPGFRQGPSSRPRHSPRTLAWRITASAAHTQGKPLVAAEVLTLRDEHYHVSLSQGKPQLDILFASGINHVVFHGTAYSPDDAPWPGFSFYAATELKSTNPIWGDLPELSAYITRCQSVLQDGTHDNDVLVYWPQHDLWATSDGGTGRNPMGLAPKYNWEGYSWVDGHPSGVGNIASGLVGRGWQFNWVSDRQLAEFAVRRGRVGNEHSDYAVVVVPGARLMPVETLRHLRDLASAGGTVVFVGGLPDDVPGLGDLEQRRAQWNELRDDIGGVDLPPGEYPVGSGSVVITGSAADLDAALGAAGAVGEPVAESGLRLIRRRHVRGYHYFLTNITAAGIDGWWPLGVDATSVVALDPLRDGRGLATTRSRDGKTEVRLRLDPGESLILRTLDKQRVQGPQLPIHVPTGTEHPLDGPWTLEFLDGGPSLPPTRQLDELVSWTSLGDEETAFSGTARYTVRFEAPSIQPGRSWVLDLGDLRESARVRLNGHDVGTVWAIPFRIPLGAALRDGENVLRIDVTNLAANRVRHLASRGELETPFFMSWRTAPPTQWAPVLSGILGPVRLIETES